MCTVNPELNSPSPTHPAPGFGLQGVCASCQAETAVLKGKSGGESQKGGSYSVLMSLESSNSQEKQNSTSISAGKFWDVHIKVHVCMDKPACTWGALSGVVQEPSRGSISAATKMLTGLFHFFSFALCISFLPRALSRQFRASIKLGYFAYLVR